MPDANGNGISNLTAAQLSQAAYPSNAPALNGTVTTPDGTWTNIGVQTSSDGATSFTVFANDQTHD
jgi:hypothetical protein